MGGRGIIPTMANDERLQTFIDQYGLPEEAREALSLLLSGPVDDPVVASAHTLPEVPESLVAEERLGVGGMGEVVRVRDEVLGRSLALKTLRPNVTHRPGATERFLLEAQATAQLQHPGIMPVHGFGTLPDGRPYFTMPEVRGRSLEALQEAGETPLRRMIEILRRVCEAVGFAHAKGVVHRDLKPDNIMVGAHGEVLVLDWGLARVDGSSVPQGAEPVQLTVGSGDARLTRVGSVLGTPAYMAPEQVCGDSVTTRSDVYALGGVLYGILAGHPPRMGSIASILADVAVGTPVRSPGGPPALQAMALRCLAHDPHDRPDDASAVGEALQAWLDGSERAAEADALLAEADQTLARAASLRADAQRRAMRAEEGLQQLPSAADESDKRPWWAEQDAAAGVAHEAALLEARAEQVLWAALTRSPEHQPSRLRLAERFALAHQAAEERRDADAALLADVRLRAQLAHLSPDRAAPFERYLHAGGRVCLDTTPSGARVVARPWVVEGRRLVLGEARALGTTPIEAELPAGSWQLLLQHEACHEVAYPVVLRRGATWDTTPPGGAAPQPVPLPSLGSLDDDECYVPPGWFVAGGDPEAAGSLPRQRRWCHGFVIAKYPVRCEEVLAWLNDLRKQGRADLAERYGPREWHGAGTGGAPFWKPDATGALVIGADPDGDLWDPSWPIMMVDYDSVVAYAAWRAARDGLPWRLPAELEWEKAARGVDERWFPWGDHHEPTWSAMRDSPRVGPAKPDDYPVDCSPYGVRHMSGSTSDWCLEVHGRPLPDGPRVVVPPLEIDAAQHVSRGGSWGASALNGRVAHRGFGSSRRGMYSKGTRLVRPWPPRIEQAG